MCNSADGHDCRYPSNNNKATLKSMSNNTLLSTHLSAINKKAIDNITLLSIAF